MSLSLRRHVRLLCGALVAPAVVLGATAVPAAAAVDFHPTQNCTIDTGATPPTIGCGADPAIEGQVVGAVAEFRFGQVTIDRGITVDVSGARPLRFRATSIIVAGTLDGSGTDATAGSATATPGGPGGGAGGAPGTAGRSGYNTPGAGGRPAGDPASGAGGGSYTGEGADGGGTAGGAGGTRHGGDGQIRGGSGGGGGTGVSGGGGGGTILLVAAGGVDIDGTVDVSGGDGATGTQPGGGASGGGSGGLLLAQGASVYLGETADAHGGTGGAGQCCGYGGGGGGGEIVFSFHKQQFDDADEVANWNDWGGGPGNATGTSAASSDGHGGFGVVQWVSDDPFKNTPQTPDDNPSVRYGATYQLTSLLGPLYDSGLPNEPVSLYRRTSSGYVLVANTTTARDPDWSTGNLSVTVNPVGNTTYQWRWAGADFQRPVTQNVTVHERYGVEVHTNHYAIRHGVPITVYGYVSPLAAGKNAWLKRYSGGRWVNVTSAVIKRQKLPNGQTRMSYKFVRSFTRGTVKLEVVKPAGYPSSGAPYYEKGTSRILTIKVS